MPPLPLPIHYTNRLGVAPQKIRQLPIPQKTLQQPTQRTRRKQTMTKLCIDLCAGLGGFSQAFKLDPEWEVVTVELNKKQKPIICADVRHLPLKENLQPDCLLASPPCERNSIACSQWPKKGIGLALEVVGACLEAVVFLKPKKWILENPKGRLRWFMQVPPKSTINYCDYDQYYKTVKATDFWGNISLPMVKKQNPLKIGHVEKGWFRKGWGWDIPTKASERAKIPLGVSQAVKEGVERHV
jgi:hypothetical protein